MRAGRAYDEIAREERVTARRVRRIVAEGLKTRDAEPAQALRVAGALVVAGELRAIGPLMKRLDEAQRRLRRRRAAADPKMAPQDVVILASAPGKWLEPRAETALRPPYICRSSIMPLICAIAFAGLSPFGHVFAQFMIVWQR